MAQPLLFSDPVSRQEIRRATTRLIGLSADGELTSLSPLLVTSAVAGEGKSAVAAAIAELAARELELKTLLVDLNWLSPRVHEIFGRKDGYELSELLRGNTLDCVAALAPGRPSLLTAPASSSGAAVSGERAESWTEVRKFSGETPDAPDERSSSSRLTMFKHLKELFGRFDLAVIDGPPIFGKPGPVDALEIAARLAKSSLLVVRMGKTRKDVVKRAALALGNPSHGPVAVLMNN